MWDGPPLTAGYIASLLAHDADALADTPAVLQVIAFSASEGMFGYTAEGTCSTWYVTFVVSDGVQSLAVTLPVDYTVTRGALVPSPDLGQYQVIRTAGCARGVSQLA